MQPDVLWLVSLGTAQGLFSLHQARQVRSALGDGIDLMGFAQKLIDDGIVHDVDTLEKIAGLAMTKAEKGPPPVDPFDDSGSTPPMAAASAPAKSKAPAANVPAFPFEKIASMEDAELASGLRELLKATATSA